MHTPSMVCREEPSDEGFLLKQGIIRAVWNSEVGFFHLCVPHNSISLPPMCK